ncbi:hypothetical protein X976_1864 [Burkholderia pseudomallei MSHR7500]|uniref:hypothetical protein n=1 Tax=Burkholderia pseudomallei TaxID=28450 RepID=UPI0005313115|nr:hypothetical protein [Burkholderia pseudomallei]KGS83961.1 hypothetical protein X976_1864 [Burkholderia pseudomallei MSHR7500]
MSYLHQINVRGSLLPEIFDAISFSAMQDAYNRAKPSGKLPEEPDFVASLVKHGVQKIKQVLDRVFNGTGIHVATTGVFCHQSPMVKFKHNGGNFRCELGDILFVHIHKDKAGFVQRNALLLQAKMTEPSVSKKTIPAAEQHQLSLYQCWPNFIYDMKGGPLHGKRRTIAPQTRHAGAQYLLIDSAPQFAGASFPTGEYPMAVWMAETPLYTSLTFGNALFDFLTMGSGRQFSAKSMAKGWSKVIWDLIENGLKKGFTRRRTGHVSTPGSRMEGSPIPSYACFSMGFGQTTQSIVADILGNRSAVLRRANDDGSIPPELLAEFDFQDPIGGISLVLIETDESELREEFGE